MNRSEAILRSTNGEAMALDGVAVRGRLSGLFFDATIEQHYTNRRPANVEVVYTFPLASDAVLLGVEVTLGGRELRAKAVAIPAAEERFESAIADGHTALMVERAADGLVTVNLGNLMAGEAATIRYRYGQLLRHARGHVRLAIPTVVAPRYGNPGASGLQPHQAPVTALGVAYPFALAIELDGEVADCAVASPSHAIVARRRERGLTVTLAGGAELDRDFVLTLDGWAGRSVATAARDGEGCVVHASFCTAAPAAADARPLRLKLLVDCSGSMAGDSLAAARRALHEVLASLEPRDRFSLSRFGDRVVHELGAAVPADRAGITAAAQALARMHADLGGTQMAGALAEVFALGAPPRRGEPSVDMGADVLLITDGEIWGADALVAAARAARQRVFVVAIGSAPAESVLTRLADATGGACEFVAPGEDAEAAMLRMFERLRAPRIEGAEVRWPATPRWTTPLPKALFGGETVHVFAGFDALPEGSVGFVATSGQDGGVLEARAAIARSSAVDDERALEDDRALARLAAALRLPALDAAEQVRLALAYDLLSPHTHLLVVHERHAAERAQGLPELARVAQMHAAGWHGVGSVLPPPRSAGQDDSLAPVAKALRATAVWHDEDRAEASGLECREPPPTLDRVTPGSGSWNLSLPRIRWPGGARKPRDAEPVAGRSKPRRRPAQGDFEPLLRALDRDPSPTLPGSIDALEALGLPFDLARVLVECRDGFRTEGEVLDALYAILAAEASRGLLALRLSRQLKRKLRERGAMAPPALVAELERRIRLDATSPALTA